MFLTKIIFFLLIVFSCNVFARMYQWTEPDTGTTQLSGKPPAWYRSVNGGPRVFVFEQGRLIDDTAIEVTDEIRQRMRQEAFIMAEEDRQKAQEKMAKANELKAKYKEEPDKTKEIITEEEESLNPDASAEHDEQQDQDDTQKEEVDVEKLRAIISEWEKSQTESAKKTLE